MSEDTERRFAEIRSTLSVVDLRIRNLAMSIDDIESRIEARLEALEGERESEGGHVCELNLCEASRLHLRPGILYRFRIDPECALCIESGEEAEIKSPEPANTRQDSPSPEPGEPEVVGYVGRLPLNSTGNILPTKDDYFCHPVILQSDHEAVVRGLREKLEIVMAQNKRLAKRWSNAQESEQEAWAEITRLKAENERKDRRLHETAFDVRDLRAENERLEKEVEAVQRLRRIDRDSFGTQMAALGRRARELEAEITHLKAERDAYADPANWRVVTPVKRPVIPSRLSLEYVGPTPSDTEAESVEGEVCKGRHGGAWYIGLGGRELPWPEGSPVRITRIPTPGGSDGEE